MVWDYDALTVSKHYVFKDLWVLKGMRVSLSNKGKPIWTTGTTLATNSNRTALVKEAVKAYKSLGIVFIPELKRGYPVTKSDIRVLYEKTKVEGKVDELQRRVFEGKGRRKSRRGNKQHIQV